MDTRTQLRPTSCPAPAPRKTHRPSAICTDSYDESLAAHHPWLVRKAARLAFRALPPRDAFLETMNVGSPQEAVAVLGEALPHIAQVYSITQELFARHQLLDLP
ncbi:PREDICTED: ceramide-1-phosphate transfer protein [Chaetura pelagica]|uniref:ceramide-1-phosphate transfer protein n=1 Tax=Chaetura pelagica TaxID=8897 RepID=UPI000523CF7A|nr:PREDICTED: ceramide-1-phosphate transfer protein [Chaetura pelagica]